MKKIVDKNSGNSWKHVVSLTFEIGATAFSQFLKNVANSFGSKNTISHVYLQIKATLKHIDNSNVTWPNQELEFLKQQEKIYGFQFFNSINKGGKFQILMFASIALIII